MYLLLLQKGDGGVKAEESKYTKQAIVHLHSALPVDIGVVLDNVRGDEGSRRVVNDGRARIVPVLVRDSCEVPVSLRLYQTSPILNACDEGKVGAGCDCRSGSDQFFVFVE